jgi:hypothetical protein
VLVPILVFHRALFLGEPFLPADLLGHLYPWKAIHPASPDSPWNVLRFDGITQFYPWRLEVARSLAVGRIPLWNPFAFAAQGGTPLLANSQSAPLYPPNLIFLACYRLPGLFWYAFGLSAAFHLWIAAKGTYRFLRSLSVRRLAALLGAITFCLSAPVITWLALPTFLAVSCWIPWLLLLVRSAHKAAGTTKGRYAVLGAGMVGGIMLLAGHLQMAFYGLLAAFLYALFLGVYSVRSGLVRPVAWVVSGTAAGLLALCLSLPQALPAVEISRVSHRAVGAPTMEAYAAYVANAFPPRNLVTLLVPDFFGHPNRDGGFYWNTNNYAEWAAYVGVAPLVLAVFAIALPWRGPQSPSVPRERAFFTGLFLLISLLAMGTPVNLPFFFLIPGYNQTGNPARCLVLAAFALAALAALGLDALLTDQVTDKAKRRAGFVALATPLLLAALGVSASAGFAASALPNVPFSQLLGRVLPGIQVAGVLFLITAAALVALPRLPAERRRLGTVILVLLSAVDLAAWGYGYNPTAPPAEVYPETDGLRFLRTNARDALIAPLNRGWSLGGVPPRNAVLPPNALTTYGLHDVAGYDSLFPGAAKEQLRRAGNGEDPSPPENGNLVFVKTVDVARAVGAGYIVAPPEAPDLSPAGIERVYAGLDMVIYRNPDGRAFDPTIGASYKPTSFRVGLFCALAAVLVLAGAAIGTATARRVQARA